MAQFRVRFQLRWLIATVIVAGCVLAVAVEATSELETVESFLSAWVALYGIPITLIWARGIPIGSAVKLSGIIILCGSPAACFAGLFYFLVGGYAGLVGGFVFVMLLIGLASLFVAAFSVPPRNSDEHPSRSPDHETKKSS